LRRVDIEPSFAAWREVARSLLAEGVAPEEVSFRDGTQPETLELGFAEPAVELRRVPLGSIVASREFVEAAQVAARHADPERWSLLYRLLWRVQQNRDLLKVETDEDVAALRRMERQVQRDLHKMHAFVRFRCVTDEMGNEHYIAWYRPDHHILEMAAPFFQERFPQMRWTILTPEQSVGWEPGRGELTWGPGMPREAAPEEDELESLWRSYYASIFNPARVNPRAMRSEMPVRYWQNLPEIQLLPQLLTQAGGRVETMMKTQTKDSAAPYVPKERSLPAIVQSLPRCHGCDLYQHAIQAVPGAGGAHARLMLVGEQPGNEEDKEGLPFVGPAGRVLDQILDELEIDRKQIYVTNAVKHFKFVQRGKLRLHQTPRLSEVTACRPWLVAEIETVRPRVVVALGATAAKSLLGAKFALMKQRGTVVASPWAEQVVATIHPSAVLRAPDETMGEQLRGFLRHDLKLAYKLAA
jgi:probable DNA metabolism protein